MANSFVIFGVGCAVFMMCLASAFFALIDSDYPNDENVEADTKRRVS